MDMGMVNAAIPHESSVGRATMGQKSTTRARRPNACSSKLNPIDDGLVGQQLLAGEATRLAYMTDEAVESNSFLEKRPRDFGKFPGLLNLRQPVTSHI